MDRNGLVQITIKGIKSTDGQVVDSVDTFFTTELYPMYSSKNKVIQKISSYLKGVSESLIDQLILKYSYEANLLSKCDKTDQVWLHYVREWVTFNASLDLLYNSKLHIGDSDGKVYKKLGDFALSKDSSSINKNDPTVEIIDKIKCEITKLEPAVKACMEPLFSCKDVSLVDSMPKESSAQVFIKSAYDPERPVFGRRFVQDMQPNALRGWYYNQRRKYRTDSRYPTHPMSD